LLRSVFLWKKIDPRTTAMPVNAIVKKRRFPEKSFCGLLLAPSSLSAGLTYLHTKVNNSIARNNKRISLVIHRANDKPPLIR